MESIYRSMRDMGLTRPRQGRMMAGVCAGLGRKFGMDANMVRLLFVLSLFIPGSQVLVYIALMLLMPDDVA